MKGIGKVTFQDFPNLPNPVFMCVLFLMVTRNMFKPVCILVQGSSMSYMYCIIQQINYVVTSLVYMITLKWCIGSSNYELDLKL